MCLLRLALCVSLFSAPAFAQQFQSGGVFPGGTEWTEGVECADVDNDGDLDVFFVGGEGTGSAGAERQNRLVMNLLEVSAFTFADESVARLGVATTHGRAVTTGDIDADGWIDALVAVGFETDPPFLYVNRAGAQPGFFDSLGASRGLTEALSSSDAQFGDVDDDGDLDIVINDAGADFLGGSGGLARLYTNDGSGSFTEAGPGAFPVPAQVAPTAVRFVDMDGDWDLDFLAAALGGGHVLMLNDGAGLFTDASGVLPGTGASVYEFEPADLDADTDADLFVLGLSSLEEGGFVNDLIPGGTLALAAGSTVGGDDDREVALFDYDQDRDLDAFIASPGSSEKMLENRPGGVIFQDDSAVVESISDTTLDVTVADLNNDGAYDLISAQGESSPASWGNRWYENTSIPDVLAPTVVRQQEIEQFTSYTGPWVVRGEVRDQVLDDGKNWVSAVARYVVLDEPNVVDVSMSGFDFVPQNVTVPAGTTVRWDNPTFMAHTVTSSEAEYPFNSGTMPPSALFEYTFVTPGVYDYFCIPHVSLNMLGTVTVTGTASQVEGVPIGGGQYRFELLDTEGGEGDYVVYELEFTDWAGNATVAEGRGVELCGWKPYGVGAGVANVLVLDGGGSPSIGEVFLPTTSGVVGAVTVTFVSLGQLSFPLLGGVGLFDPLLFVPDLLAAVPVAGVSTNTIPIPNKSGLVGVAVYFQSLAEDLSQSEDFALSNGLQLTICP